MTMRELAGARVAISNRGEIAIRIAATVRRMGAIPVALLGEPDLRGLAAREIGLVEPVGPAGAELHVDRVIAAAKRANAAYLHPGYGFLSERAEFSEACLDAGIVFIGPSPETLRLCGDKLETRMAAVRANVPVLPASEALGPDPVSWGAEAERIGYPLLVKPAGAGGGRGLRHVGSPSELLDAVRASLREGAGSGSDAVVYLERELVNPRHVEVQVASDGDTVLALGDRDCSLQRRHQKVIEEAPAPNVDHAIRARLHQSAADLAREVGLRGIATCEFLLGDAGEIAFLEINPRIQVEHPVTELVTGLDLVEWQLRIAAGQPLPLATVPEPRGHAVEARVYAEDPAAGFLPSAGELSVVAWPHRAGIRIDPGYASGDIVPTTYDAMLAKVIAHGPERRAAVSRLRLALADTVIAGVATNLTWLDTLLASDAFDRGESTTSTASTIVAPPGCADMARLAVLAELTSGEAAFLDGAWEAVGAWRMSGAVPVVLHGDDWETRYRLEREVDAWLVDDGSGCHRVRWLRAPDGVWSVASGDHHLRAAVTLRDDGYLVTAGGGGRWAVRLGSRPRVAPERAGRTSGGSVTAPMPASVTRIHVVPGDRVQAGQALVTLTAMKMELTCEAPFAGSVAEVHCEPGLLVDADRVLVTVSPEGAGVSERA